MNDEENMAVMPLLNVQSTSEKRKIKKGDKKNAMLGQPELRKALVSGREAEKTTTEQKKKKKGEKNMKNNHSEMQAIELECGKALCTGTAAQIPSILNGHHVEKHDVHGMGTEKELASSEKPPSKKKRKEKKDEVCPYPQEKGGLVANGARETAQVWPQNSVAQGPLLKKRLKNSKDLSHKAGTLDGATTKSASDVHGSQHAEELVSSSKLPMQLVNDLENGEASKKNKKKRSEQLGSEGTNRLLESKREGSKDHDKGTKDTAKKRKQMEDCDAPSQDCNSFCHVLPQSVINDEENTIANALPYVPSEKRRMKKGDKKNARVDHSDFEQPTNPAQDVEKTIIEQNSKRKKKEKSVKTKLLEFEGARPEHGKAFFDENAAQTQSILNENNMEGHESHNKVTQKELALLEKSPIKSRKDKKDQDGSSFQEQEVFVADGASASAEVLWQNGGVPKKKSKKSNDLAHKTETQAGVMAKSISDVHYNKHLAEPDQVNLINLSKQPKELVNELEIGKNSTKKKHTKEMCLQNAQEGMDRLLEHGLQGSKDDYNRNAKESVKKRKQRERGDAPIEDYNLNDCNALQVVMNDGEHRVMMVPSNVGNPLRRRQTKKSDKKDGMVGQTDLGLSAKPAQGAGKKIEQCSKEKKREAALKGSKTDLEGLKSQGDKAFINENVFQGDNILKESDVENERELASSKKSLSKRRRDKKDQDCQSPQGNNLPANAGNNVAQVLLQNGGVPKNRSKKSKELFHKMETEDGATMKFASDTQDSQHLEELDELKLLNRSKQSMEPINKLETREVSTKKKKHIKELCSEGAQSTKRILESRLEESKGDDNGSMKDISEKRKGEEDGDAEINDKQDKSNLESTFETSREIKGISNEDANMHDLGAAKAEKKNDARNKIRTPSGALAFKRVDVEKVKFMDPRLTDNSYWAKNGAEEGYGARAQEVLGAVRGRDFRHEKTKKKRGSYRGGFIGLESYSIKFENSDDED